MTYQCHAPVKTVEMPLFERVKKTQCERLLEHFSKGKSITSLEAYIKFGITQLGTRISELEEKGYRFTRPRIKTETGKTVCRYSLKKED